jgi:hypothetical protein
VPPRQLASVLLVVAAGAVHGCNYPTKLPIEYETEHLRIGIESDDGPLCQGDLVEIERQLDRIEDELEFEPKETYTVYIWSDQTWSSGAMNNCDDSHAVFGCTSYSRAIIWTTRWALGHELVHAAIGSSNLHPFFEEGLAEVYGGRQTRFGSSAPSANKDTDRDSANAGTGAHFIRWLRERWGPQQLARLARTGKDSFSEFESIYGMTIEEAEQLYFAEAPFAYAPFSDCDGPELASADFIDGWIDTITLDCATGVATRNSGEGIIVHRTLEIPEPGYYSVSTDGEWFDIYRCGDRFDDVPDPDWWTEDVPSSHAAYPSPASRFYAGGEVHDLYFEAGTHDIGVGILGHEQGVVNVAIWPSLAPTPGGSE